MERFKSFFTIFLACTSRFDVSWCFVHRPKQVVVRYPLFRDHGKAIHVISSIEVSPYNGRRNTGDSIALVAAAAASTHQNFMIHITNLGRQSIDYLTKFLFFPLMLIQKSRTTFPKAVKHKSTPTFISD